VGGIGTGGRREMKDRGGVFGTGRIRIPVLLLLAGLVCAGLPRPGFGLDNAVRVLTLDEALRIAGERNREIRQTKEFRSQVAGRYLEERAAALPHLTANAQVSRTRDALLEAFGGSPIEDSRSAGLEISQALFTWGQVGAAIRAAKMGFSTADERLRMSRQSTVRDVTASFYDVLLARELDRIARQNLEQKVRHFEEAKRKEAAGTATDYDVLAAKVGMENARPEVIRAENRIRISREQLRFRLGIEGREVDADGNLDSPVDPYPRYEDLLETATANRPELGELRSRRRISEELVRIEGAGDKPRLDLKASLGWQDLGFGPIRSEGTTWSAGLHLSWPLFDGLRTRGRVAQAESDLRTLRIEEEKLADAIALEVRRSADAVRESGEIVRALSGTVEQAERLLRMAEKGFEYGVKTRIDVEDAELSLVQAKGNLARARRDYLVARTDLAYATGTLGGEGGPGGP